MSEIKKDKIYIKYALDVLEGKIVTGNYIKLACKRFIDRFNDPRYYFKYDDVDKKIKFVSKIKHTEGKFANKPFNLLPFQQWIYANIYGFYYTDEPDIRVTTQALIIMARKQGKSVLAASMALVGAICDNETNPSIAFIANSAAQASILFKHCSDQCKSLDPNNKIFNRFRHDIRIPLVSGQIQVLSSDTTKLDGRGDSVFIQDEGHEARTTEIYNILRTGQGARKNPLAISISTTGFNIGEYPLYMQWENAIEVLKGTREDESLFSAIYQLDDGDDWKDENVWVKSNPSLDVTVPMRYMREQIQSALNNPSNEVSVKTKNLNMWVSSSDTWISYESLLDVVQEVDISKINSYTIFGGVDLSTVSDISAFSICAPPDKDREYYPDKFIFKSWLFLPEDTLNNGVNKEKYKKFKSQGEIIITPGNVIDYDYILREILKVNNEHPLTYIEYDTYNATQWAINATEQGLSLEPFSQSLGNFNKPTKYMEILIKQKKCVIDKNFAVMWCFQNIQLKYDQHDNIKPVKAGNNKNNKIDPVISMLEALGGFLSSSYYVPEMFVI